MNRKYREEKENVVLTGFMGSGKTSVGIRLSYRLQKAVLDTDKMIESREGRSISDIFAAEGEPYFRDLETALLRELAEGLSNQILSVGGGLPLREENRTLLRKIGTVVYLRVRPETVYERLKNDTTRPLLQGPDPLEKIRNLLEARRDCYESGADLIVDVDNKNMEEVLADIREGLERLHEKRKGASAEGMKLLVINGPNLNFLGIREKNIYGTQDYQYLCDMIREKGEKENLKVDIFQSNHEGAIIDRIQEAYFDGTEGIVINPGAYTHYSYAIRDALASITVPKVEVHISDITSREEFRKVSVTAPVCDKQIYGRGFGGYLEAMDFICGLRKG